MLEAYIIQQTIALHNYGFYRNKPISVLFTYKLVFGISFGFACTCELGKPRAL